MRIHHKSRHLLNTVLVGAVVSVIVAVMFVSYQSFVPESVALSSSEFKPGHIIDDIVFYNKDAMSAAQIQTFLNQKVPTCDTLGAKIYSGTKTRAQSGTERGYPPPYICLKDYRQDIPERTASSYCDYLPATADQTAAQIIYAVSQACGVNPQVLLVLLQKEQSLVTDEWPFSIQYRSATGYGCPDTAPCDAQYYGFFNQIYRAAWQYKVYRGNPNNYNYRAGRNNYIQYNPTASCGGQNVFIDNQATAGLYIYTPYVPNQKALDNLYGTGDSCSAYGNRNFWRMFTEWFGSTLMPSVCNSKVSDVVCVWETKNQDGKQFFTTSIAERDSAVNNYGHTHQGVAFYAYDKQVSGSVPVHRINRGINGYFYTINSTEKDIVLGMPGATYEGIVFYVFPTTVSSDSSYVVFRLNNSGSYFFTSDSKSIQTLVNSGYTLENNAFNTPSSIAPTPLPSSNRKNIYRLNGSEHFYTTSIFERDGLLKNGWIYEGVLAEAPISETSSPVYRLNGPEHLYTINKTEQIALLKSGWVDEGIAWYADSQIPAIYRLNKGEHFYTTNLNEAILAVRSGWAYEGIAFGALPPTETTPVYRLNNGNGKHFYTASINELFSALKSGWTYEGIGWYTDNSSSNLPVYRFNISGDHFYTASTVERDALLKQNVRYEGIAFYASKSTDKTVIYRFALPGNHFYTASTVERDALLKQNVRYEGIAW